MLLSFRSRFLFRIALWVGLAYSAQSMSAVITWR